MSKCSPPASSSSTKSNPSYNSPRNTVISSSKEDNLSSSLWHPMSTKHELSYGPLHRSQTTTISYSSTRGNPSSGLPHRSQVKQQIFLSTILENVYKSLKNSSLWRKSAQVSSDRSYC